MFAFMGIVREHLDFLVSPVSDLFLFFGDGSWKLAENWDKIIFAFNESFPLSHCSSFFIPPVLLM